MAFPASSSDLGVAEMQAVLEKCSFDPDPVDGLWGGKTVRAALDYVRAHGGSPVSGDQSSLMAQVDGFRVGDQGLCPADHAATGPVKEEESVPEQVQQQEPEITGEARDLIAQIKTELDGKSATIYDPNPGSSGWSQSTGSLDINDNWIRYTDTVEFSDGKAVETWSANLLNLGPPSETDINEIIADGGRGFIKFPCLATAGECGKRHSARRDGSAYDFPPQPDFFIDNWNFHLKIDTLKVIGLIERLAASSGKNTQDRTTPQCYEWIDLGSIADRCLAQRVRQNLPRIKSGRS